VIPPEANAEFVCQMEEVLQLYTSPFDPDYPLVCFDESSKQLISETREPLPPQPGQAERFDYEYQREGVCNLFMFFEPLTGTRHVEVTDQRTSIDYAQQMKYLVDERHPRAKKIRVVQDNLNTHVKASLKDVLTQEVAAWEKRRNQKSSPVDWRFTTEDARIKLKRLYPSVPS
jgi:hypothetical protein